MTKVEGTIELLYAVTHDDVQDLGDHAPPMLRVRERLDEIDGVAVYHLDYTRDGEEYSYEIRQPFAQDGTKEVEGKNVWAWDGDRDEPTLTPSYGWSQLENGWLVHLFLRDGEIHPCSDMALEVA